jgi:hypothetical protein
MTAEAGAVAAWECPSCGRRVDGTAYCGGCGERRLGAHDRTLGGLLEQWIETVFHVDGRLWATLNLLWRRPGQLTAEHAAGRRRPYLGPFQLFLAVTLVFFLVQLLSGLTLASVPLESHLRHQSYSPIARDIYAAAVARHGSGPAAADAFAEHFEPRERTVAKSLLVLLVPVLALATSLLFVRRRVSGPTHVVFALHFVTAMMVFLSVAFPLLSLALRIFARAGHPVDFDAVDTVFSWLEFGAIAAWFWFAVPRVFGIRLPARVASVIVLSVAVPFMFHAYRFVVFLVTTWTG